MTDGIDPHLAFTVASVWREERVSCPHPDLLASFAAGGIEGGAAEFLTFHLRESQCPYCNAVLEDLAENASQAQQSGLVDMRDRLLRSTIGAVRSQSGR